MGEQSLYHACIDSSAHAVVFDCRSCTLREEHSQSPSSKESPPSRLASTLIIPSPCIPGSASSDVKTPWSRVPTASKKKVPCNRRLAMDSASESDSNSYSDDIFDWIAADDDGYIHREHQKNPKKISRSKGKAKESKASGKRGGTSSSHTRNASRSNNLQSILSPVPPSESGSGVQSEDLSKENFDSLIFRNDSELSSIQSDDEDAIRFKYGMPSRQKDSKDQSILPPLSLGIN